MNGAICPTCSCSLVRLGVDVSSAPVESYDGAEYNGAEVRLCRCPGCLTEFHRRPDELLARLAG